MWDLPGVPGYSWGILTSGGRLLAYPLNELSMLGKNVCSLIGDFISEFWPAVLL